MSRSSSTISFTHTHTHTVVTRRNNCTIITRYLYINHHSVVFQSVHVTARDVLLPAPVQSVQHPTSSTALNKHVSVGEGHGVNNASA